MRVAIWIVPAITFLLAATNEQHHLYWPAITEVATPTGTSLVYGRGAWYWWNAGPQYFEVKASAVRDTRQRFLAGW